MRGTFKARAREWQLGLSSGGNEQVAVMFEILDGEAAGQKITWFGSFSEKTSERSKSTPRERTFDSLRHCGWDSDSLVELDNLGANEVEIVLDEEEYEGRISTKVKWVNKPSRLALKNQMSPAAALAFANKLRGATIAHKNKYGAQPTASAQPAQRNGSAQSGRQYDPNYGPDAPYDEMDPDPF